jgi:hypothetical protein
MDMVIQNGYIKTLIYHKRKKSIIQYFAMVGVKKTVRSIGTSKTVGDLNGVRMEISGISRINLHKQ